MSEKKPRGPLPLTSRPSRRVSFKIGLTEDEARCLIDRNYCTGEDLGDLARILLTGWLAAKVPEWRKSQADSKKAAKRQRVKDLRQELESALKDLGEHPSQMPGMDEDAGHKTQYKDEPATGGPAPITLADEVKQGGELLKAAYEDRMEEEAAEEIYGESGVA